MYRHLAFCLLATTAAPALADTAVLVGNSSYQNLSPIENAAIGDDLSGSFDERGYNVVRLDDPAMGDLTGALSELVAASSANAPLVVLLNGHFAHTRTETYLLPVDAPADMGLPQTLSGALPLSTVTAPLAALPGQAMLLLGSVDWDAPEAMTLTPGIGQMDIPQGVTVATGAPATVAAVAGDLVTGADAPLARDGLWRYGYLPADFSTFAAPVRQQAEAGAPQSDGADDRLWENAASTDTVASYRLYLDTYPEGAHADEARAAIARIEQTPFRAQAQAEESLDLSREARQEIQRDLSMLDYDTRGIDGIFGPGTRTAIGNWQAANEFEKSGYLTRDQISRIDAQAKRRAEELEEEARKRQEEKDARDQAFWEETGQSGEAAGLRAYLAEFPDGKFAEEAQSKLDALESEQRAEAGAEDRAAWDAARNAGTIEAYQTYLNDRPEGQFTEEARAAIETLRRDNAEQRSNEAARKAEQALGLDPATRSLIEQRLAGLDLEPGAVDGEFDDATRRAIRRFQSARGLETTGYIDQATAVRMLADTIFQR